MKTIESWYKGEQIRFTGQSKILHGGRFSEAKILTGHKSGELTWISHEHIEYYTPAIHAQLIEYCRCE